MENGNLEEELHHKFEEKEEKFFVLKIKKLLRNQSSKTKERIAKTFIK